MRKSKVLAKLCRGAFARISSTGHFLPFFIRHAAENGYDGIWLDLEHRTMDEREVQAFLAACHYNDIDCMVRPPTRGRTHLYHYLEDGASGFMFPFISTADDARAVVSAVRFPPIGNRGLDGAGLDADYGFGSWKSFTEYAAEANRETFILAQIETPEAVSNIEEIAAVPGIDCLFVGPGDLGLRLTVAREPGQPTVAEAIERTADAARRNGKAWGTTAGTIEDLARYRRMGAQVVPWIGDFALAALLRKGREELDAALGEA
jgi:2-keto-3-deoxy-L-rhamnonate aldolase RhmA